LIDDLTLIILAIVTEIDWSTFTFQRFTSRLTVPMPRVVFTSHLQKHVDCPPQEVAGGSLREVLDQVFDTNPRLRGYILDDQGRLRRHVVVFIDDQVVADRVTLADTVSPHSEVYVMQALSGG
jgi:sulfur-carrier protein